MRRAGFKPRTKPLRSRKCNLRPAKAIKRKPRSKGETLRIYGPPKRGDWLRSLPCVGCARIGTESRPTVMHHTENGGMGKKGPAKYDALWLELAA